MLQRAPSFFVLVAFCLPPGSSATGQAGTTFLTRVNARRMTAVKRAADHQEKPWTSKLWVYDLRTNRHFTLKTNPLKRSVGELSQPARHLEAAYSKAATSE